MRAALLLVGACIAPVTPPISGHVEPAPPPRLVAIATGDAVTIVTVSHRQLSTLATHLPGGAFGWLDATTLAIIGDRSATIVRYTGAIETTSTTTLPAHADDGSFADRHHTEPWPRPPTGPTPDGVALAVGPIEVDIKDLWDAAPTGRATVTGVTCDAPGAHAIYPDHVGHGFDSRLHAPRWISAHPPIFELVEDSINPAGFTNATISYARPCAPPFDGFAWLGDGVWASFALSHPHTYPRDDDPNGVWTFHAGDAELGTIAGRVQLRANR